MFTERDVTRMLAAMGESRRAPSLDALTSLTRSWLFTVPFHNLDLLARTSPLTQAGAAEACLSLRGGGCHVHAAGFLALLQALDYDARFTAASIGARNDHLIVKVIILGETYWCDVGNGQPYVTPFSAVQSKTCAHLGWTTRTEVSAREMTLYRMNLLQPSWWKVYETTLDDFAWSDFADVIERHHTEPGFGPFLTGLRAVRIEPTHMTMLRDEQLTVWRDVGVEERRLTSRTELAHELENLHFDRRTIEAALGAWRGAESDRHA